MEEQLISFETAKLAKEKGFNINTLYYYGDSKEEYDRDIRVYKEKLDKNGEEECRKYFNKNYPLWCAGTLNDGTIYGYDRGTSERLMFPTQSLLQKWFREKHNLYVEASPNASGYYWIIETTNGTSIANSEFSGPNEGGVWDKYEDSLEVALFEAIKLI